MLFLFPLSLLNLNTHYWHLHLSLDLLLQMDPGGYLAIQTWHQFLLAEDGVFIIRSLLKRQNLHQGSTVAGSTTGRTT